MNYWWVNQKQTFRQEIGEGYMWSPKYQQGGRKHFSYEYMKHVEPGDIIFSYANAEIIAVGIAKTHCYSFPKPSEFGKAGMYWSNEGWKVDVNYNKINNPVRTMDHIVHLRDLLPASKSPIKPNDGGGNQAYLFKIEKPLALALARLIDNRIVDLVNSNVIHDSEGIVATSSSHINDWENIIDRKNIHDLRKM